MARANGAPGQSAPRHPPKGKVLARWRQSIGIMLISALFVGQPCSAIAVPHHHRDLAYVDLRLWEMEPYVRGAILSHIQNMVGDILDQKHRISDEMTALQAELKEGIFGPGFGTEEDMIKMRRRIFELSLENSLLSARLRFLRQVRQEILKSFGTEA